MRRRETQVGRLTGARGMSEAEVLARMAAQATREQRAAVADVIIDNDGDRGALQTQIDALWERLRLFRRERGDDAAGGDALSDRRRTLVG